MKLYAFPPSPNSSKVLALIRELKLPVEIEIIDITKGASRTEGYLELNPTGRTPTLVDGDLKLWESTAILVYVASRSPNSLYPDDVKARADILRWQSWSLAHWTPPLQTLTFERVVKGLLGLGASDPKRIEEAETKAHTELRVLDAHLAGRDWLVGTGPTIADFEVGAMLTYAEAAKHPLEPYPHVRGWYARLASRPGWQATDPLHLGM